MALTDIQIKNLKYSGKRLSTKDGGNPISQACSDTLTIQFFRLNSTAL